MIQSNSKQSESVKLGDVVSFKTGKLNSNAAMPDGAYPFFTCSPETFKTDSYSFDTECVLLSGNNASGVYSIKYFRGKFDVYQRTYVIRSLDDKRLINHYLYYALQTKLELLKSISTGAATKFLTLTILRDINVELPPLPIQRKIVAILSAYDDMIESNIQRIKILEEMAKVIYQEWFVKFHFPGHGNIKMVDSELGPIPEGWEAQKLSALVETQYGYTESASEAEVGPKYVRGMDINKTSYIEWDSVPYCPIDESDHSKYRLSVGDVLVIRMADPGKVGVVEKEIDAVFASYLIRLNIKSESLSPYYLFYFLLSDRYQGYITGASTGTTRKSASAGVITDIEMVIPTRDIREKFEQQISTTRRMLNMLLDKNANLRRTRDMLLPKLISGELDVEDLDIETEGLAQ